DPLDDRQTESCAARVAALGVEAFEGPRQPLQFGRWYAGPGIADRNQEPAAGAGAGGDRQCDPCDSVGAATVAQGIVDQVANGSAQVGRVAAPLQCAP